MSISETELSRRIARGEDSHTELRREVPDDAALARTLCAFANTRGGWLVVGADGEGTTVGCANPGDVLTRIRLVAEEDLKPSLVLDISGVRCEGRHLVVARVKCSDDRPHSIPLAKRKREILVRVGADNHVAEGGTLNAMRSHRTQGQPKDTFESKILAWIGQREAAGREPLGSATPEEFSKAVNAGERRASKAFVNLECAGLLVAHGERGHRYYALP